MITKLDNFQNFMCLQIIVEACREIQMHKKSLCMQLNSDKSCIMMQFITYVFWVQLELRGINETKQTNKTLNKLHYDFSSFYKTWVDHKKKHVTLDMWHMKCDMWHVTHDTWLVKQDTWQVWGGEPSLQWIYDNLNIGIKRMSYLIPKVGVELSPLHQVC